MQRAIRIMDSLYLLFLSIGIGGIIACGAFAAPIIFHAQDFISQEVANLFTNTDSGQIMGQIFLRLNGYLLILLVIIVVYELLSLKFNPNYSKVWLILGLISAVCIVLFAWYYTPFILNKENLQSDNFHSMHEQSVWVFKILTMSLSILLVWRGYKLHS
ncbi:DUF4149 domain-containing protein [Helicobacter sp. MIT 14-3879]|nr:DUF4149 domain-containing protein [Helicobacter sp. MIT 14-3879]